jgi:type II secretory pathway pseudopilin PulG
VKPVATPQTRRQLQRPARGFTYLGVLLLVVLMGTLLAGWGQRATLMAQHERERELLSRGEQIRAAIASYRAAVEPPAWPAGLDDLLVDRRGTALRHHLRRAYPDPFTRQADWVPIPAPAPATGWMGVRSRASARRLLQREGPQPDTGPLLSDWRFVAADTPREKAALSD